MFKLIDEIAEVIYVADVDTYELLYLNSSGKHLFQVDNYEGEKCYRLLQGRDEPCEFCTNHLLSHDSVYTWRFTNEITDRHFILKDKLVEWNGRTARMEIGFDLTEQEEQEQLLKNKAKGEELVLECLRILYQTKELETAIQMILEKTGKFLSAERAYIFEIEGPLMNNTHEWCADHVKPEISHLQNLSAGLIDRWRIEFENNKCIFIRDMEEIRTQSPEEYRVLSSQGIKRLIAAPLFSNQHLAGYIGVDNPPADLFDQVEPILETLSYFLSSSMDQMHTYRILKDLSYHDTLTGLYNRNRFNEDLEHYAKQDFQSVGVIYLDLNGLKDINDSKGHQFGDQILKDSAKKLQVIFSDHTIYRIGGDEFAILCLNTDKDGFMRTIRELKYLFSHSVDCSGAVGYSWSESPCDFQALLTEADEMMYTDKKEYYRSNPNSSRYRNYFDDRLNLKSLDQLLKAIEDQRFCVYLQPKVLCSTQEVIGAEALVRYISKDGAIEPPIYFIPVLESAMTIKYVDFFVFEKVCQIIHDFIRSGSPVFPISVNFSRYTLLDADYLKTILAICDKYKVPRHLLEFEITESAEYINESFLDDMIRDIKKAGFSVALDDFGVKYANLSLVLNSDIDTLKLDKSMIDSIESNEKAVIFIQALAYICKTMNIQFIVEGVETQDQFEILKALRCEGIQGYLFGRPMPLSDFCRFLEKNKGLPQE